MAFYVLQPSCYMEARLYVIRDYLTSSFLTKCFFILLYFFSQRNNYTELATSDSASHLPPLKGSSQTKSNEEQSIVPKQLKRITQQPAGEGKKSVTRTQRKKTSEIGSGKRIMCVSNQFEALAPKQSSQSDIDSAKRKTKSIETLSEKRSETSTRKKGKFAPPVEKTEADLQTSAFNAKGKVKHRQVVIQFRLHILIDFVYLVFVLFN